MRGWKVRVLTAALLALGAGANSASAQVPPVEAAPAVGQPAVEAAGPVTHAPPPATVGGYGSYGYSAPVGNCESCTPKKVDGHGSKIHHIATWPCDGGACQKPWGCSNFCAERCFLFGSCRQFFGKRDYVPPPGVPGPVTTPCDYGTWHRW